MNIALITTKNNLQNKIFSLICRDKVSERFVLLKKKLESNGHTFNTIDYYIGNYESIDLLIFLDVHNKYLNLAKIIPSFLIIGESPIIHTSSRNIESYKLFVKIFTWEKKYVNNKDIFHLGVGSAVQDTKYLTCDGFNLKKDCCMIYGNKKSNNKYELYSKRAEVADSLSQLINFDSYGQGYDRRVFLGVLRPFNRVNFARSFLYKPPSHYISPVVSKFETLSNYKFSLAFENAEGYEGYISEKIFDIIFSGTFPIYKGCSSITSILPSNLYVIYDTFESDFHLSTFIKNYSYKMHTDFIENVITYRKTFLQSTYSSTGWSNYLTSFIVEFFLDSNK